uniref:2Fe-2S ferredoxin-type domain-containing protein n=1 Tax=Cyclophora tenuis TaxID=216820 RepID=A0A7S1CYE3_CYCTE|mmetsp:Transcript_1247/g.2279  ORF Transcript_1247/g.2279 Transcript_1247/m.2279 type:complete len:155 (+) Transcript_1247:9-473(+)
MRSPPPPLVGAAVIAVAVLFIGFADQLKAAEAFGVHLQPHTKSSTRSDVVALHLFGDALKGAFANDPTLGKKNKESAGLKGGGPKYDQVTLNGKPIKAVAGQKVSQVAAAARVKITYSCKKGDCGTCEILMNGRMTKACQAKIPAGKCDMQTLS